MVHFQDTLQQLIVIAFPLLLALTAHETAHGYVADRFGDPTPRLAGRLTLNPLAHLDAMGTLVFVVTQMIGWAKPVPVNSAYFRDPKRAMLWVSLAGPAANFLLAIGFALGYHLLASSWVAGSGWVSPRILLPLVLIAQAGVVVNLGLGLFNLVPIPPLDGSRILVALLPERGARAVVSLERYGFVLLLILVFSGALRYTVYPSLRIATRLLLGT